MGFVLTLPRSAWYDRPVPVEQEDEMFRQYQLGKAEVDVALVRLAAVRGEDAEFAAALYRSLMDAYTSRAPGSRRPITVSVPVALTGVMDAALPPFARSGAQEVSR